MRIEININPVPASRPRVTKWAVFYPKKYTNFRIEIAKLLSDMYIEKYDGLLELSLYLEIAMPKSWSKKKKLEKLGTWQDGNADNDNYEKAVWDALNGIAYNDDCQIVVNRTERRWQQSGKITVIIKEFN